MAAKRFHLNCQLYVVHSIRFQTFFVQAFKVDVDSWNFPMLLLYTLWLANFYDFRFKWTATAAIGIHSTKAWLSQLVNFKNAIWTWGHFRRTICNKILFLNLEKMTPQKRMECFRLLFDHLAWIEHQFLSGIRDSRKEGNLWGMMRGVGGVRKSIELICQRVRVRVTMLRFQGSSGRDSVGRGQLSSNRFRGIPPGQCTSPQLHPCHRLFDQDGHQDSSPPSL